MQDVNLLNFLFGVTVYILTVLLIEFYLSIEFFPYVYSICWIILQDCVIRYVNDVAFCCSSFHFSEHFIIIS